MMHFALTHMLGTLELKLHMPKDKASKGYNRNKSISKIATKKSLAKQIGTLARSLLWGLCGPAKKVMHSTHSCYIHWGRLNWNCMPTMSHRKTTTGIKEFLELQQKISAPYTHLLSNLERLRCNYEQVDTSEVF